MKSLHVATLLCVLLLDVMILPGLAAEIPCQNSASCGLDGACCVQTCRRVTDDTKGVCRPLGKLGSLCYLSEPSPSPPPGQYWDWCRCGHGLTCQNVLDEPPLGPAGVPVGRCAGAPPQTV